MAPEYPMNKQVMIPVAFAVIHNFIHLNNPNDRLLRRYNLDGHTIREVDPRACRVRDDRDDSVPNRLVTPNLVVGQDFTTRVRDDMADQIWRAFYQNLQYRQVLESIYKIYSSNNTYCKLILLYKILYYFILVLEKCRLPFETSIHGILKVKYILTIILLNVFYLYIV